MNIVKSSSILTLSMNFSSNGGYPKELSSFQYQSIPTAIRSITVSSFTGIFRWMFPSSGTGRVRVVVVLLLSKWEVLWVTSITAGYSRSSELRGLPSYLETVSCLRKRWWACETQEYKIEISCNRRTVSLLRRSAMKASVWAERGWKKAGMCPSPGGLQLLFPLYVLEKRNRDMCDDKTSTLIIA